MIFILKIHKMKKLLLILLIPIFSNCNQEQELSKTSWYGFDGKDSTYAEVSFGDSSNLCFNSEDVEFSAKYKKVKDTLITGYDLKFREGNRFVLIKTLNRKQLILTNLNGLDSTIFYKLPYKTQRFMQTETYKKEFQRRLMKKKFEY